MQEFDGDGYRAAALRCTRPAGTRPGPGWRPRGRYADTVRPGGTRRRI